MTRRRAISKATRARIFLDAGGCCAACAEKITGRYELDHCVPLALGGRDDATQLHVLCIGCHRAKTRSDVKAIAKTKRLHRSWTGGKLQKKRKIAGRGFDRSRTRKFDGSVVPRRTPRKSFAAPVAAKGGLRAVSPSAFPP